LKTRGAIGQAMLPREHHENRIVVIACSKDLLLHTSFFTPGSAQEFAGKET
jgi:hypothetical protein